MENFIRTYNNAFTDEYCDSVIKLHGDVSRSEEELKVHDHSDNSFRRDVGVFLDSPNDSDTKAMLKRKQKATKVFGETIISKVDEYLKDLGIWKDTQLVPDAFKVQKYEASRGGGYYAFHSEQSGLVAGEENIRYMRRYLTYTLYLNDVPKGEGETEFLFQGYRYQPKKGDLVLFPAFFTHTHRGNPVYTTDKYIATGWMLWANPNDNIESN
jgi:hypothetical protein